VKPGFYIPWIYVFLDSMHIFIGPAKASTTGVLNFPGIYVCAFYPIPWLYVQIELKLACCCRFKYFQLEIRKKNWFSVIISCLLYCLRVHLLFYGFKVVPAERSRISYRHQACVVTNDLWFEFEVPRSKFHALIKSLCGCCFVNLLRIKLANSFILISGRDSVFITMTEPRKRKAFSIQEKMDILAQVDANKETCCTGCQVRNCAFIIEHYC
jgi:hypothetical protein